MLCSAPSWSCTPTGTADTTSKKLLFQTSSKPVASPPFPLVSCFIIITNRLLTCHGLSATAQQNPRGLVQPLRLLSETQLHPELRNLLLLFREKAVESRIKSCHFSTAYKRNSDIPVRFTYKRGSAKPPPHRTPLLSLHGEPQRLVPFSAQNNTFRLKLDGVPPAKQCIQSRDHPLQAEGKRSVLPGARASATRPARCTHHRLHRQQVPSIDCGLGTMN